MKHAMINISLPRYGTRMLSAGDPFECNRREARVLNALKKARYATDDDHAAEPAEPVQPVPPVEPVQGDGGASAPGEGGAANGAADEQAQALAAARTDYQTAFNKRPYHGWSVDELRQKISAGGTGES